MCRNHTERGGNRRLNVSLCVRCVHRVLGALCECIRLGAIVVIGPECGIFCRCERCAADFSRSQDKMGDRGETRWRTGGYAFKQGAACCRLSRGGVKYLDPQGSLVIRGVLANSGRRRVVTPLSAVLQSRAFALSCPVGAATAPGTRNYRSPEGIHLLMTTTFKHAAAAVVALGAVTLGTVTAHGQA